MVTSCLVNYGLFYVLFRSLSTLIQNPCPSFHFSEFASIEAALLRLDPNNTLKLTTIVVNKKPDIRMFKRCERYQHSDRGESGLVALWG